jgi:hypothetical protein
VLKAIRPESLLTPDEQNAKLALIADTAQKVCGGPEVKADDVAVVV